MCNEPFAGKERICPVCGKTYIMRCEEWAYKRQPAHGQTKYFCSWRCLNNYEASIPKKVPIEQRTELIRMLRAGAGVSEIVRTLGVEKSKVRYWKERIDAEG